MESDDREAGIFKTKRAATNVCNNMHDLHYYFSYMGEIERYDFDGGLDHGQEFKREEFAVVRVFDG